MGLLDDAIREHLELKRRRGADPGEVARQEEEALGDPRAKEPDSAGLEPGAEAEAQEPDATSVPELEAADAEGRLPGDALPELPEDAPVPYDAEDDELEVAGEPGTEVPGTSAPREESPWLEDEPIEQPRPRDPEPDPDEPPTAEQPAPADEDVLEDTPEFLQDTPEHDRLWFEQRPPRDFDFDS
jgi:hypothetical protein